MYLVGSEVVVPDGAVGGIIVGGGLGGDEKKRMFTFRCQALECGDLVDFGTFDERERREWMTYLRVSAMVTYGNAKILAQQYSILSRYLNKENKI